MPLSLSELQDLLDQTRRARAGGEKRVYVRGPESEQEVEYKTDAEMAAAIYDLERQIALLQGSKANTVRIHSSKGL